MVLNYSQIDSLIQAIDSLKDEKMPFKVSLILARNATLLKKEEEFFMEQERDFAMKFLVYDEEKQEFVQSAPNMFMIKEGMQEECRKAREELNNFTVDVELRKIPISAIENMDFTPTQLSALELILDEEE